MNDRFTRGFLAGFIAGIPAILLNIIVHALNLTTLRWADFASVMIFGHKYQNLAENIFASLAVLIFTGALGVVFAFLLPLISSKNYLLKAWLFSEAIWFMTFAITYLFKVEELGSIPFKTALSNLLGATIWGITMGYLLYRLDERLDDTY